MLIANVLASSAARIAPMRFSLVHGTKTQLPVQLLAA
jgi:hypothetical protein